MRLIVVGGVAAGAKAAARAKRFDPSVEVLLLQNEPEVSYTGCGQPYYLSGIVASRDALIIRRPEDFAKNGVEARVGARVEQIDLGRAELRVHDGDSTRSEGFDRLVLATGASPVMPALPGVEGAGVVALRSLARLDAFKDTLDRQRPRRAVIIGGGYIGLEVAETLHALGLEVTIMDLLPSLFSRADAEVSEAIETHLREHGIAVRLDERITDIERRAGRIKCIVTDGGERIETDLVVMAVGIRPNVELAAAAGVSLGATGAIKVDERMQTSEQNVFAAGDCVESQHRISGKPVWNPLGDIANLQGRVAGENAAGGSARFPGVLGTGIFRTLDLNVAMTGLTHNQADEAGLSVVSTLTTSLDRARYYPGGRPVTIKLTALADNGRLVGAQVFGPGAVDKMIDILATALLGKLTCFELASADLAYAPPFSPVLSPVITAASVLSKKIGARTREGENGSA